MITLIKSSEILPANHADYLPKPHNNDQACSLYKLPATQTLPIVDKAMLRTAAPSKDGIYTFSTTISAKLQCPVQQPTTPVAFKLTDTQGRQYIVGLNRPPFPIVRLEREFGQRPTDNQQHIVNILWQDVFPALLIK